MNRYFSQIGRRLSRFITIFQYIVTVMKLQKTELKSDDFLA